MGERWGGRGRVILIEIDSERDGGYVVEFVGYGCVWEFGLFCVCCDSVF